MLLAFAEGQSTGFNINKFAMMGSTGTPKAGGARAFSPSSTLRPESISKYTIQTDTMVKGFMCKTAQSISMLTRHKFMKRYYQLNKVTKLLSVYEAKETSCKLKQQIDLSEAEIHVDDLLARTPNLGYEREMKQ